MLCGGYMIYYKELIAKIKHILYNRIYSKWMYADIHMCIRVYTCVYPHISSEYMNQYIYISNVNDMFQQLHHMLMYILCHN